MQSSGDKGRKPTPSYDPVLAGLFASSLGPVKSQIRKPVRLPAKPTAPDENNFAQSSVVNDQLVEVALGEEDGISEGKNSSEGESLPPELAPEPEGINRRSRKRKRKDIDDDLEGEYLQNLARQEFKEDAKRRKQDPVSADKAVTFNDEDDLEAEESRSESVEILTGAEGANASPDVPQHETLGPSNAESEMEKASRTVFLANVSTAAIRSKSGRRAVLDHLASFVPSLPHQHTTHRVESLRFRSIAFASAAVPKKAAFAKKELMDSTTKSTNAYAVYTTQLAAREATKELNGTIVLDRHLRVDSVAHPAKQDHRRCVFVGNLGFVDDESAIKAAEEDANNKRPRKAREAADVEEGLWRQFSKAGTVESVRVVRDKTTRVGKGFAYVQFEHPNGVEKALLYNEKKFPPLLPRVLRVTRAKNVSKMHARQGSERRPYKKTIGLKKSTGYQQKSSSEIQSLSGRVGKLLGRARAAQFQGDGEKKGKLPEISKSPKAIVFEGYRAKSGEGKGKLKLGRSGNKKGKPQNRSSKRGAAFKASGKKKAQG